MNQGKLKFGDKTKPHMQVDVDALKDVDAMYTQVVGCNVVEAIIVDAVEKRYVEEKVYVAEWQMVEASGHLKHDNEVISES